ncbi:MAG: hypothetical protein AB2L22_12010 [Syntrophales bacterium]
MEQHSSSIDFIGNFYSKIHSENSFLEGLESLLSSGSVSQIRLFPVYISPLLWNRIFEGSSGFHLVSHSEDIFLFKFSFTVSEHKQKKTLSGKIFLIKNNLYPNIYIAATIEDSLFFSRGMLPFFEKRHPLSSLTFITHKKLKYLLVNFRDKNIIDNVTIIRTTTYSRIGQKIVPSVNWPAFSLDKAFEWVSEENGWFQNVTLKAKKTYESEFTISISRKGVIKTNGHIALVYRDFILPISRIIHRNIELFGNRARLDNPQRNINPLSIDLASDVFDDINENAKFIDAMKTMKSSSVSVIHSNPYVHISVIDYYDGSSFDLWVLSLNRIIIVPQLKASFQSVKRLINHIFDNYAEGDIRNYEVNQQ